MTTEAMRSAPDLRDHPAPTVLDGVACLVLVVDPTTDRVLDANRALVEVLGLPLVDVVGQSWREVLDPAEHEAAAAAMSGPGGPLHGVETGLRTVDGTQRRVLWSVATGVGRHQEHSVVLSGIDLTSTAPTQGLFSHLLGSAASPALVGTDAQGRVTLCNSAAATLLGRPVDTMMGHPLDLAIFDQEEFAERAERLEVPADLRLLTADHTLLDRRRGNLDLGDLDRRRSGPEHSEGEIPGDRRRRRGTIHDRRPGGNRSRDWTLVRGNGERFTALLQIVPVTHDDGSLAGYLGVVTDVTEQRRSRNLLVAGLEREAEAVRRLKELDRAKDDFVATVSHELRTPITNILGYVEVLLDADHDQVDPAQQEMLEAVRRNGNRLRALADDLLTLSSFETDEFSLDTADVDLGGLVGRVERSLGPLVSDRRLEISFDVPVAPVLVLGDAAHLERVLVHLLSNALKFTEDGGSVGCSLSTDGTTAQLQVADTGMGIPEEEQRQLFTRFFRASTAREKAVQGSGMGLAIVSAIVHRHGGTATVESRERVGTTVTVSLPVK